MNIKFGMNNFYVRYLKRFLNSELTQAPTVLGEFNKDDQQALIKYLNLPNVKDMFAVEREITQLFPELNTYFNIQLKDEYIKWTSKIISSDAANYIKDNIEAIKTYCESVGWYIQDICDWVDPLKDLNNDGKIDEKDREIIYDIVHNGTIYESSIMKKADLNLDKVVNESDLAIFESYLLNEKLYLTIVKENRTNYFPNKDMLVFINQFDGTFIYNYAIRDQIGTDDIPHVNNSGNYKIALYKCKPGQKLTIAHNNTIKTRLVIGSSPAKLKQDITSGFPLENVVDIELPAGEGYEYTCSSEADGGYDANWVCIQCPSNYNYLTGQKDKTVLLEVGDINFDGKIDEQDYHLLAKYTAVGPGAEELHWQATDKQLAVMDTDDDKRSPNYKDAVYLRKFLDGDPSIKSLGLVAYTYKVPADYENQENVSNLLIIDGHYPKYTNIPFKDFIYDDWIIHEKFFNYLLGMAIHKYSSSEDISYLQKLLKEIYTEHSYDKNFFYPGVYSNNMKNIMLDYQRSKTYYTQGDLNLDNKLDNLDLNSLREYLDTLAGDINGDGITDEKDQNLLKAYIEGQASLTEEQKQIADINHDGVINDTDLSLLIELISTAKEYQKGEFLTRADVNQDGKIDELDYTLLQEEVQGIREDLRKYEIPFMLGWCDVQTEANLEYEINISGNISEVSK